MIVTKDSKSDNYIITAEDNEGYHKSINLTHDECVELYGKLWESVILDDALKTYQERKSNEQ